MVDDINTMKAKIAKLLAKAQGTDNESEAAAFLAKAEALMDEWQLQLWEVTSHGDAMGYEVMMEGTSSSPTWQRHLMCMVAEYYGCKTVRRRGLVKLTSKGYTTDNFEIDVIGRESSRVTTQLMYPFIMAQLREAGRKLFNDGHRGSKEALTRRVANALVYRIHQLIEQRKRGAPANAAHAQRALVVVNEVKAFMDDKYPGLKMGIARARNTTAAASALADKVSIERQVKSAGPKLIGGR